MRLMLDPEFDGMQAVDALREFDPASCRAGLDAADADDEGDCGSDSVWLECNGELIDVGWVKVLGVRKSACGFETLVFRCPRCKESHESIRFR